MGLGKPLGNLASSINSVYKLTLDVSGWDKTTVQVVGPMLGTLFVYGSLDGGDLQGVRDGSPQNATNFNPILATNLAIGSGTATITGAGTYEIPVANQYVRLQGSPAAAGTSVYKLYVFNSKIG